MRTLTDVLPPRTRLFHIGPQKTGTTALQMAAASRRPELLEHGVYYPGSSAVNHRYEVAALVGKVIGWKSPHAAPPPRSRWHGLVRDLRGRPERVLLSHEYAAGADDRVIAEVAETFGDDLHVLITLRSLARLLPSIWQETIKAAGGRGSFDKWLHRVFDEDDPANEIVWHRHDHGALVRRWAEVVGPRRVTVIALDPKDHGFLFHRVEQLLGLPTDLLAGAETAAAHAANRSLSLPEAELFRRFNRRFRTERTTYRQYDRLVMNGAVPRVLGRRKPSAGEPRLTMPDWAADRADELSLRNARAVAESGVRVIGDPDWLAQPAKRHVGSAEQAAITSVPIDLAVEAMMGVSAAALGLDSELDEEAARSRRQLSKFTAKELAAELSRRGRRRLGLWAP